MNETEKKKGERAVVAGGGQKKSETNLFGSVSLLALRMLRLHFHAAKRPN
jgi:hypothetical protein